jgi:ABC-type transporter Mla subunit MlaD
VSLDTTIGEVKRDVQVLTDLLQSVLDQKTVTSLKHSIDNLQKVTQTLTANSEKLDAMIVNAERAGCNPSG